MEIKGGFSVVWLLYPVNSAILIKYVPKPMFAHLNFLDPKLLPLETLDKSYSPWLVLLSVVIAVISSYTAFGTSERIHASKQRHKQVIWTLFGAISMGVGIWAMHFIGMLALILPVSVSYDLNLTLLSVLPAILASCVVLWQMNQTEFNLKKLLFSGVLLGSGIGVMHYTGMAAMKLDGIVVYLKSIFWVSIAVAVIYSTVALKIQFEATHHKNYQFINSKQALSALVMGAAVSGMHYTAMEASIFIPAPESHLSVPGVNATVLSDVIATIVLLVLTFALVIPNMLRFRQMAEALQKSEESNKIAATAFQTHEAILVTDENARIIKVNDAFTRITGYSETEVLGKNAKILKSGKHNAFFYKNFWNTLVKEGKWSGEIWNRRKNGEIFLEWQTISAVKDAYGKTTHYVSFFSDIMDSNLAEQEIEKLAFYDPLTELPNRRLLYERLEHELKIARRYQRTGLLFFLDLDRFKHINDSLGHSIGDQLLIESAQRLQSLLRDTDTAARLGGDEFIILVSALDMPHNQLLEQSNVVAKKIISAVSSPYHIGEHELFISASIGITLYTGIDESVETLLKRADTAMYHAKDAGRNTYRFYQQSMQEAADTRLVIEKNLRVAIARNELSLYYQPQLSENRSIIGAEALIRWNNNELGMISPVDFIPIAEETGLILPIGQWIMETVCDQILYWDRENLHIPHIAVNISAKQFHQADFVSMIVRTVAEKQVKPERIMLEITESVFLGSLEEVTDKMRALKKSGFSFSIDDFGTGYSSLTYLQRLPFDQLKIDQSFVRSLVKNLADAEIVKAIIYMANALNLHLIAEGVETEEHLAFLSRLGCANYQGFFFSKPLEAGQFLYFCKQYELSAQPT